MNAVIDHAKHVARKWQRAIERGEVPANGMAAGGERVQRRHCLHAVAVQLGFASWHQARQVLSGQDCPDRGLFMFYESGGSLWNIWSASLQEAQTIHRETLGFLLPYKHQFQIVEAPYLEALGLDPRDASWEAIGRDWVQPHDESAWLRLARQRMEVLLNGRSPSRFPGA